MSGTTSGVSFERAGDDTHMRVFRGKTLRFNVIWGGSSPIDVTGYDAILQMRDLNGDLILEMSVANGKISVGGADGVFSFSGTDEDTRAVSRAGLWEMELTSPDGEIFRALSGIVTPVDEVVV